MKRRIQAHGRIDGKVELSGSKYLANRLLFIAAMASQPVILRNVVFNDDINTAIEGLNQLGYQLQRDGETLTASPRSQLPDKADIFTAHSGTFSRFIAALASNQSFPVNIIGSDKMNTRPMADLFNTLSDLGVSVLSSNQRLPVKLNGPWQRSAAEVDGSISSQFVSGLLLTAGAIEQPVSIHIKGTAVSSRYIDMTIALMQSFGAQVERAGRNRIDVISGSYSGGDFSIPPDPVSSSYFMAAAAINRGHVQLTQFDFDSKQGEAGFPELLKSMGCSVKREGSGLTVSRDQDLVAIDCDMGEMPDTVQTLAAVATAARGTTVMRNIAHLAFKESNRIVDTATELKRLGYQVDFGSDYLAVTGDERQQLVEPLEVSTYDDHRMAMSLALVGSRLDGVIVNDAEVVSKSFPDYWQKLASIGILNASID